MTALGEPGVKRLIALMQHRESVIRCLAARVLIELVYDNEATQIYLAETFGFTPASGKVCLNSIPVKIQALLRERPELIRMLKVDAPGNGKFWSFPPFEAGPKPKDFPDPREFIIGFRSVQTRKKPNAGLRIEAPTFPEARVRGQHVNLNLDTTTSFYSDSPNSRSNSATPERQRPSSDVSPPKNLTIERRKDLEALKEPLVHSPKLYSKVMPEYSAAPVEVRSPRFKTSQTNTPRQVVTTKSSASPRPSTRPVTRPSSRPSTSPRPTSATNKEADLSTIEASLKRIKGALGKPDAKARSPKFHSPAPSASLRGTAIGRHSPYERKPAASSVSPIRMKDPESVVLSILRQQRRQVATMVRQSITSPRRAPLSTSQRLRTTPGKFVERPIFKV